MLRGAKGKSRELGPRELGPRELGPRELGPRRWGRRIGADARRLARRGLHARDLHPLPLTPRPDLEHLLTDLHPVTTNLPLVRIGPPHDGGYLVPDDLEGIAACFSPGVDVECGFDLDMAERGVDVFLADASVAGPAVSHPRFHFAPRFLGLHDDDSTITLDTWVRESIGDRDGDLLLQMDIEGAEWQVLTNASTALLERFRIMVIEWHGLDDLHVTSAFRLMEPVLRRVLTTHMCVHIHRNSTWPESTTVRGVELTRLLEMTFLRRDRAVPTGFVRNYPHALDAPNTPGDLHLPPPASLMRQG